MCVHWDIQSHWWVETGNTLLHSNATHSTCHFTYLSTYAIIRNKVSINPSLLLIHNNGIPGDWDKRYGLWMEYFQVKANK